MSVIVVGAGIGGLAAARALHKVGIPVTVLEKADTLREEGASINIGTNGWKAMDALGVAEAQRKRVCKIERYVQMRETGKELASVTVADCAHGPHEIRGCSRNDIVRELAAGLPAGTIHYNAGVSTVSLTAEGVSVTLQNGETMTCKILIGADGAYSKVKAAIGGEQPQYSGWATYRGMASWEEGIPDFAPEFCIMQGEGIVVGLYPLNTKERYYFYGFGVSQDGATELKKAGKTAMKADLLRRVKGLPRHIEETVARTPEDNIFLNHIGDGEITQGQTWGRGLVTLVGDAAHPTTPALGQGGCMALEDGCEVAAALGDVARAANVPWAAVPQEAIEAALRDFERRRSTRCAPLVARARQNGRRLMTKRSWLGIWMRDWAIYLFAFKPATMFDYMVWDPPSLERAVHA